MLFDPNAHEPLTEAEWNPERVRTAVRDMVANAETAFDPDGLWPTDERDATYSVPPLKNLYVGAAGVVFALDALRRSADADVGIDLASAALRALELWKQSPDYAEIDPKPAHFDASLLCGEVGILLVAYRVTPSGELADRLFERVVENVANDANEVSWGAPGTMIAATAMHSWTGEERWRGVWTTSADELRSRRDADGLWTQHLFGREPQRQLGAAHGAVGNQSALLQGAPADDARPIAAALAQAAVREGVHANWPMVEGAALAGPDGAIRVQWCHGAPGVVLSAASYLPDELLLAGAELTWQAGPLAMHRGPGICHGTAGNGYALLATFARTGDERWLERARAFATHAVMQVKRQDRPRHSLWTGDLGVALYAVDCLEARAGYPVLEGWV